MLSGTAVFRRTHRTSLDAEALSILSWQVSRSVRLHAAGHSLPFAGHREMALDVISIIARLADVLSPKHKHKHPASRRAPRSAERGFCRQLGVLSKCSVHRLIGCHHALVADPAARFVMPSVFFDSSTRLGAGRLLNPHLATERHRSAV